MKVNETKDNALNKYGTEHFLVNIEVKYFYVKNFFEISDDEFIELAYIAKERFMSSNRNQETRIRGEVVFTNSKKHQYSTYPFNDNVKRLKLHGEIEFEHLITEEQFRKIEKNYKDDLFNINLNTL